jgi:protein gp37
MSDSYWTQPLAWNYQAERAGRRTRVFCASMADVFEDRRDLDAKRTRLWELIEATPHLDWLLLTKRPQNVARLAPYGSHWPANIWLGATAETQRWLDRRMDELRTVQAKVLFLSCEPLLGPLDFTAWIDGARRGDQRMVDWVIAGGESGGDARPMHPEWVTSIRDQCVTAGIKFLFKQWGNWRPIAAYQLNGYRSKFVTQSDGQKILLANVGKKAAGRRLERRTWNEYPA